MESAAERVLDLGTLGFDQGAHVLVRRALLGLGRGERLELRGSAPELAIHAAAWARAEGHRFEEAEPQVPRISVERAVTSQGLDRAHAVMVGAIVCAADAAARWRGAERAGASDPLLPGAVAEEAPQNWGLAARGAIVEAGAPAFDFQLTHKDALWSEDAASLYAQALSGQWDPATAIPWSAPQTHSDELEDALVQVLTYLIENETAALLVPARFASQTHPHYREVLQLLAIQIADEARHIEVFTRRATLRRKQLGLSSAGGQTSLKTLVDEPSFSLAALLLSVMGEGSFVNLLWFLHERAPDECTRTIMRLTAQDEARHVAFGVSHLTREARLDSSLLPRLASAIETRHDALRNTTGLNAEVFDALILLAAGGTNPSQIASGYNAVLELTRQMHAGRRNRLRLIGFSAPQAEALSALHTRNFM